MQVMEKNLASGSTDQAERRWSYTSGTSDTPLLGLTIGDLFDQTVEKYPDHPGLISRQQNIRLTYRDLQDQVNRCAKGLMHLGFQKGQRVGIWSPNRAEWCVTQFATSKIGVILVNINPAYRLHELEYALKQSGCSGIVIAPEFKTSNYTEMLYTLAPELRDCEPGKLKAAKLPDLTTVIRLGSEKMPGMFIAELDHPDFSRFDLTSLRTGVMAGSPCPSEVMKKVISLMHMREVEICYGMTETSPVSTQPRIDAPLDKRVSTVGVIHPHLEIKIVDPNTGQVVPVGKPGELCTRGYSVMLGYWNNPEATAGAIDQARWMHTGDLATMDAEGYINIVGRIKDMIIRGGENVYPREIEEFLYTHPKISDVQVIGLPDPKYGEEIMAWVRVKPGEQVTAEELQAFCKGQIAHYKVPRYFKFVDAFPMTVTGKIQKFQMRQQSTEELGLQSAASIETA